MIPEELKQKQEIPKLWYGVELEKEEAEALKVYLKDNNIYFEASACYNLIHIKILANAGEVEKAGEFLGSLSK